MLDLYAYPVEPHTAELLNKQAGTGQPRDLTDGQWERLEPLIPAATSGRAAGKTDMRGAMNAVFYLLRPGCPGRYLPRDPFPPRLTV